MQEPLTKKALMQALLKRIRGGEVLVVESFPVSTGAIHEKTVFRKNDIYYTQWTNNNPIAINGNELRNELKAFIERERRTQRSSSTS